MQTQTASQESLDEMNSPFWDAYFRDMNATLIERVQFKAVVERNNFDCIVDVYPKRLDDGTNLLAPVLRLSGFITHIHSHADLNGIEYKFGELSEISFLTRKCYTWVECFVFRKDMDKPFPGRAHPDEVLTAQTFRPKERLQQCAFMQAAKLAFPLPGMYIEQDFGSEDSLGVTVTVNEAHTSNASPAAEMRPMSLADSSVEDLVAEIGSDVAGLGFSLDSSDVRDSRSIDSLSEKDRQIVESLIEDGYVANLALCKQFIDEHADNPDSAYNVLCLDLDTETAGRQAVVVDPASPFPAVVVSDPFIPYVTCGEANAHPHDLLGEGSLGARIEL